VCALPGNSFRLPLAMRYHAENDSQRIPALNNYRHGEAVATANSSEDLEQSPSPAQDAAAERRSRLLWMLGLALLAFAIHAFGILAKFVFDDVLNIEHRSAADVSGFSRFFTSDQSAFFGSNFYRPVLNLWFEVAYKFFGPSAPAWHLLSILLHVACTLLVFRLALHLVENTFVAGVAAALFAVHPAHTEAISWASAMGDPLMTLFLLLSVLGFLCWMEQGKLLWWAASFVAAAACVLTKEPGVMLPVVLLVSALALRSRAKPGLPVLLATLPFFALSAAYLVLRQSVLGTFSHPLVPASTGQMIFTWPSALLFYLRHMFLPPVVAPYYPVFIVQSWKSWAFFGPLLGLLAAAAGLGFLLWRAAGWRKFCFCLAWILAPLAPALYVKALAPFELVHDRFLYAPLVGFCIAAALVLHWATEWTEEHLQCRVLPLVAVVLVLLLSIESFKQMIWWQNNMTLFTRAVMVTPENPRALGGLADANLALGRYDEATQLLQRALVIDPQHSPAMFALGRIAWLRGDDATAEKYFLQALSIQPRYDMWLHLASIEMHRNQVDKAETAVRQALALNPTGAGAHAALGTVLLSEGNRAAAAAEFQEELRIYPQSEVAQVGLSRATGNGADNATVPATGNAPR
jgi:tetratricopeptide (TPR) repeat protein